MDGMKFKIGDKVYKAGSDYSTKTISCPDCLGTKEWIVTFADGQSTSVDCQTCKVGYCAPYGHITYNEWQPTVRILTIGRIYDWSQDEGFRYMCNETGISSGSIYNENELFFDKKEAELHAENLYQEQMKRLAQNNFSKKFKGKEAIENMLSTFGYSRRAKFEKSRQFIQWAKISDLIPKKERNNEQD